MNGSVITPGSGVAAGQRRQGVGPVPHLDAGRLDRSSTRSLGRVRPINGELGGRYDADLLQTRPAQVHRGQVAAIDEYIEADPTLVPQLAGPYTVHDDGSEGHGVTQAPLGRHRRCRTPSCSTTTAGAPPTR